ncbi:MAG: tRNA lysidine(34) synthetase TilS, partial [Chloroflexi bacterium]|nr:tRNA lysidine(34) synthetase TilS [Chloroflexota bacterium]
MPPLHPFERRLASALHALHLAGRAGPLLLAVSGGPDSTALLAALAALRVRLSLQIRVLHVDHGLRPDSPRDAAYVRRLCQRLGVPTTVVKADVKRYRRDYRLSVEEAARQVRYAALARAAIEIGARAVLTAHTADDQAETVLLHLLRGTGLRGLSGMAASSPLPPT